MDRDEAQVRPPLRPSIGIGIGVTGHRAAHPAYCANEGKITRTVGEIFDDIDRCTGELKSELGEFRPAPTQLTTLMVDGADQAAAELALERGWKLASPLPFGRSLNIAINALPNGSSDAQALLEGDYPNDRKAIDRARQIEELTARATIFDLADQDERISQLYLAKQGEPHNLAKAQAFAGEGAVRAALAGRIVISQSDILIAVWDGVSTANPGGTGHTVVTALDMGVPVIWIDPAQPARWRFLQTPESLANLGQEISQEGHWSALAKIIEAIYLPDAQLHDPSRARRGLAALYDSHWRDRSAPLTHAYRKIEAIFGGDAHRFRSVTQTYERPDQIGQGSAAGLLEAARNLQGSDHSHIERIEQQALQNFAWADGLSARLSDHYRGGMVINFLLSSIAIVGGVAYLPLVGPEFKWPFALFEFLVLMAIVIITWRGITYRWHGRWFETRRVAEYFRHSPFLLLLGIARAPGRSAKGAETSWPEWMVRHAVRDIGLPNTTITGEYLRGYLDLLLQFHVNPQRDYHQANARRLKAVHHNLDRFSELLFKLAIVSVASYLLLEAGVYWGPIAPEFAANLSKTFTVLGVMFPTFGGAIAGIRFFGDFERFAAISEVTSQQLDAISQRVEILLQAPDNAITYGHVAELALATEDVVVSEIENWQAVFRAKQITVPV